MNTVAPIKTRDEVITFVGSQGFPPLPVAPAQDPYKYHKCIAKIEYDKNGDPCKWLPTKDKTGNVVYPYCPFRTESVEGRTVYTNEPDPLFTGKNPSFINSFGKPQLVKHQNYQEEHPSRHEIEKWFKSSSVGVGTLGGFNNTVWIDIDVKQFDSQDESDRYVAQLLEKYPILKETWQERTHSGGYRFAVKCKQMPEYTNFAFEPGGKHRGEALGFGRFTVLAPTIGPSGNPYVCINQAEPVEVESLEAIGIFPTKVKKVAPKAISKSSKPCKPVKGAIALEELGTELSRQILAGDNPKGDRSESLATAIQEWCGWSNWCESNSVPYSGDPVDLAHCAGEALGIDSNRVDRILATVAAESCQPAALSKGDETSCWLKVKRLNKAAFKDNCPPHIKEVLRDEVISQWREKVGVSSETNAKPILVDFVGDEDPKPVLKKGADVAAILYEEYRETLAFNLEIDSFYRYEAEKKGVWTREYDRAVRAIVQSELDSRGASGMYSSGYISNVVDLLASYLAVRHWDEVTDLLPLENGVLELSTMRLLPHSPGYRVTWQLPYAYNPVATCEPIIEWMKYTQDEDESRVQLLRAYLKAVITGRSDLQRFVQCLGPGGSGKSTFANLAIALVGIQNVAITTLEQLERNRFETANLKGKRLLYITDSDTYGGSVSIFKSITGGDPIRYEEKNKQVGQSFIPRLMALVVANEPIRSTDYTSGMERRQITVPFLRAIPASQQKDLLTVTYAGMSGEFLPYLPGLLNWVLSMPDNEVRSLIKQTSVSVPSLNRWKAETLVETNPLAEWLDARCVLIPDAQCHVGVAEKIRFSDGENGRSTSFERYKNADKWLYANYCAYVELTGSKPVKVQKFSRLLQDLIANQLKKPVAKYRDRDGVFLTGITIRTALHDHIPTPVTDLVMNCVGFVTNETSGSVDFDGCVDLSQTQQKFEEIPHPTVGSRLQKAVSEGEKTKPSTESSTDTGKKPTQPSKSTLPVLLTDTPIVTNPSQTNITPGDRVITPRGEGEIAYRYDDGKYRVNGDTWSEVFAVEQLQRAQT